MYNVDSLLKELRVDWETSLTPDFNPLRQALNNRTSVSEASSFRNMFHKLESVMDKIIEENYKGFSDSVLSYMECYHINSSCLYSINRIYDTSLSLSNLNIGVKDMIKEYSELENSLNKYKICKLLSEFKASLNEFHRLKNAGDLLEASKRLYASFSILENHELPKCVDEYKKDMQKDQKDFLCRVYEQIDRFLYRNERECISYFRCIEILNVLPDLDKYQVGSFQRNFLAMIDLITKGIDSTVKENKLNALIRSITDSTRVMTENFRTLQSMARKSFEFDGEKIPLSFYGPEGYLSLQNSVNAELEKFVRLYIEKPEEFINNESFMIDNTFDDINYTELYDHKYVIYEEITADYQAKKSSLGSYTRITSPSIEAAILMYDYAYDSSLRERLKNLLIEKHYSVKQREAQKKVVMMFQSDEWCKSNHLHKKLGFFNTLKSVYQNLVDSPSFIDIEAMNTFFVDIVENKLTLLFNEYFKSSILESLSFEHDLIVKNIAKNDMLLTKKMYDKVAFTISSLEKLNGMFLHEKLQTLLHKYNHYFNRQVILEIFYYFDRFYREGVFVNQSDFYLSKIWKTTEEIYSSADILEHRELYFKGLYNCLNYYILNNIKRLNVKSKEDLIGFLNKIRLLDELVSEVEGDESLKRNYDYLLEIYEDKVSDDNSKLIKDKIDRNTYDWADSGAATLD